MPLRAHYIGAPTPSSCPDEYITAIRHLLDHYKYELQYPSTPASRSSRPHIDTNANTPSSLDGTPKITSVLPLIINTQGWVKGLGEDLLRAIEGMAESTHVFAFEPKVYDDANGNGNTDGANPGWTSSPVWQASELPLEGEYGDAGSWQNAVATASSALVRVLEPAPVSPLQARYTPADLRILSTVSYLHARLPVPAQVAQPLSPKSVQCTWDFTVPLLAVPPWEVEVGRAKGIEQVYLIGEGADGVIDDDLPLAMNGSMVALVERLENAGQGGEGESVYRPNTAPDVEETNFLALAVVRAVRTASAVAVPSARSHASQSQLQPQLQLQLLTPLDPSLLGKTTMIVKNGATELPLCGMLDWREGGGRGGEGRRKERGGRGGEEDGVLGWRWGDVPFVDVGEEGVGGAKRRFRRNLQRKGQ